MLNSCNENKLKKRKSKIPVLLLAGFFCFQGTGSALAANNLDDSAIAPQEAAYGYYVDNYAKNDKANMTPESNPSIGVLSKFHDIWEPGTSWDNGTVLNADIHNQNIAKSISITENRTEEEAKRAYLVDRRHQNYSAIAGLGSHADNFIAGANAGTTIADEIPEDATSVGYDDGSNNNGVWADQDSSLGSMVRLIDTIRNSGASTSNAKAYYGYKRPFRWSEEVSVIPTLVPRIKEDPSSDGGFPSGHTNAAYLASYGFAYAVPERYEELMTSASEMGHSRIVAGMHSPLDVIGGRVMATAVAASALNDPANKSVKEAAYAQAHEVLLTQEGTSVDDYSDYETNKKNYTERLTYGFAQTGDTTKPMVVPKGAEVLLETRFPYLDDTERRWILYTTGLPSGYPVLDDTEGWGRLNLFAAAGGYEAFENDVTVTMDASQGGYHEADTWKNAIGGSGKLTKSGTGSLTLSGNNTYSGGTLLEEGTLSASSGTAFGEGEVVNTEGTLTENVPSGVTIGSDFTQSEAGTLELTIGNKEDVFDINGDATFGGTLKLNFTDGFIPEPESPIISYDALADKSAFSAVEITGLPENYDVSYGANALYVVDSDAKEDEESNSPAAPPEETGDNNKEPKDDDAFATEPTETDKEENPGDSTTETEKAPAKVEDTTKESNNSVKPVTSSKGDGEAVENPKTGDDTNIILYAGLLAASAIAAAIVIWKRKFNSR
ncbi:LPXTG-motif cell wall anchor domain-containing protein/sortase B cell surface sorting signal [Terribacillus halophilus]|uniref:LPXTG-motif cell wall anchor domain-containing protein/sortase B cell surface sorting signal n=1 Tax=Terribacillus halophilus TaxID=361279 RepID=A0A1G6KVK5_9BACI|nr:phosphatase PAP2 family protein [Terribacillus halophilus]SDC34801.1 LPXTG-motif cell wall anchor domain-containing protein/sortase B cell surface sorting signal [Terribacillus halophilus]